MRVCCVLLGAGSGSRGACEAGAGGLLFPGAANRRRADTALASSLIRLLTTLQQRLPGQIPSSVQSLRPRLHNQTAPVYL